MITIFTNNFRHGVYFSWWDNFFDHILKEHGEITNYSELIAKELVQYNATIATSLPEFGGWAFEFETMEDATAFLLIWK